MIKKIFYKLCRNMMENDIDMEELKKKQKNGALVIDVRNKRSYDEWHISGSINIPEYEINQTFLKNYKNKEMVIVLYCSGGYKSRLAYKKLKKMGYVNVYNLYGGLENY